MTPHNDEYWMRLALKEASYAYEDDALRADGKNHRSGDDS